MDKKAIIQEAEKFMRKNIPKSRTTKRGSEASYLRHVLGARKYASQLAEIYDADKFIVEVAALLHDTGADDGDNHADASAKISRKFLSKFDISKRLKERIIRCVERHSMGSKTETIEEQIMQDADGIIFIQDSFRFYFEKQKQKLPLEEARKKSIKKIRKMMEKIGTKKGIRLAENYLAKSLKYLESNS
jgi:HD superfamily phosphodiesterase